MTKKIICLIILAPIIFSLALLSSEEYISVRFFYYCTEIDPSVNLFPEAYLYNEEKISRANFKNDFINLMFEHTTIQILDFWFDGEKLYVDLHPDEALFFDRGSTGSADRCNRLFRTLASIPGVSSFEVLVGGQRGVTGHHYSFAWVALVENGEIVGFLDFDEIS